MEFLYQIYTRSLISVKDRKTRQTPVKKEIIAHNARNIKAFTTSVHLMDKTDIIPDDSERNVFCVHSWTVSPPGTHRGSSFTAIQHSAALGLWTKLLSAKN
jgi:hypothetical protein